MNKPQFDMNTREGVQGLLHFAKTSQGRTTWEEIGLGGPSPTTLSFMRIKKKRLDEHGLKGGKYFQGMMRKWGHLL